MFSLQEIESDIVRNIEVHCRKKALYFPSIYNDRTCGEGNMEVCQKTEKAFIIDQQYRYRLRTCKVIFQSYDLS